MRPEIFLQMGFLSLASANICLLAILWLKQRRRPGTYPPLIYPAELVGKEVDDRDY